MTTDLPEGECDVLWNDGEFILSRVRNQFDHSPTLLVRPSLAHLTAASYARLNHAYALRDELDVSWAAQPTELTDRLGELSLRVKDPGGHLLATLIGKPWDVGPFLRVGIGLTRALSGLHRRASFTET
jgi:hypothetical protein